MDKPCKTCPDRKKLDESGMECMALGMDECPWEQELKQRKKRVSKLARSVRPRSRVVNDCGLVPADRQYERGDGTIGTWRDGMITFGKKNAGKWLSDGTVTRHYLCWLQVVMENQTIPPPEGVLDVIRHWGNEKADPKKMFDDPDYLDYEELLDRMRARAAEEREERALKQELKNDGVREYRPDGEGGWTLESM